MWSVVIQYEQGMN